MAYRNFYLLVMIDGTAKALEFAATDINSALADISAAFSGEVTLIQYHQG